MITEYQYKIRASGPQSAEEDLFYYQTFMAEKSQVDIYEAKTADELLVTDNFRGRGGEFVSAQYSRQPYKDLEGNQVFSATETHSPEYVEEDEAEVIV